MNYCMTSLLIGICESSDKDCDLILQYLKNIEDTLKITIEVRIYHTGAEFLHNNYCPVFDIIFLDTNLPDMPGEKMVCALRKLDKQVRLFLTSTNENVFSVGYQYDADNCWIKPLLYNNILNEFKEHLTYELLINQPFILLSNNSGIQKLYCHKLRYIETGNRQLIFHYDGTQISNYGKLSDLENLLSKESFFRCNNSYIVNIKYVEQIKQDSFRYKILLITGEEIPLSRDKKGILVDMMKKELSYGSFIH